MHADVLGEQVLLGTSQTHALECIVVKSLGTLKETWEMFHHHALDTNLVIKRAQTEER